MPREIEMKFKVASLAAMRRRVLAAGGEHIGSAIQEDCYFDTAGHSLRKEDRGVRIRSIRAVRGRKLASDRRALVTYKGPGDTKSKAKIRREIQTRVDDPQGIAEVFALLGLHPCIIVEKRRATYRLGRCLVELDELPVIGGFVEIEGPGEAAIESVHRRLGLDGPAIKDHYINLLCGRCRHAGARCIEIRFGRCGKCRKQ